MMYQSTMTTKGQIVVPKDIRVAFGFKPQKRITFELREHNGEKEIVLKPHKSIMQLAGKYKPRKNTKINAVQVREYMNNNYERA